MSCSEEDEGGGSEDDEGGDCRVIGDGESICWREVCNARISCGDGVAKYAGCLAS